MMTLEMMRSTLTKKEMLMVVMELACENKEEEVFATLNVSDGEEYVVINNSDKAEWFMNHFETEYDDNMSVDELDSIKILSIGRFHPNTSHEAIAESLNRRRF